MTDVITVQEELALRRQFDQAQILALSVPGRRPLARRLLQAIIEGCDPSEFERGRKDHPRVNDFVAKRLVEMQEFYDSIGIGFDLPMPTVSNRQMKRKQNLDQGLFYRPSSYIATHAAFMKQIGMPEHWSLTRDVESEATEQGYWFFARSDANLEPRSLERDRDRFSYQLLSLEEYVIVWAFMKMRKNLLLDTQEHVWIDGGHLIGSGLCYFGSGKAPSNQRIFEAGEGRICHKVE
jgi:hypothetical protein